MEGGRAVGRTANIPSPLRCAPPTGGCPHPLPQRPHSPAASLTERVEPGQTAVALPPRHRGLADAGARGIALEVQGACGGNGTGQRGLEQEGAGGWGSRAHSPAGWQSQGWQAVRGSQR